MRRTAAKRALIAINDLMAAIVDRLPYKAGVTEVHYSAAEAFAAGAGVCQDHMHVFIACSRALGLPARYVSGYVYSTDFEQVASHAWAEVWLANRWVSFDVSNARHAGGAHIKLAVGLDYLDACPVRGVRLGGEHERLSAKAWVQADRGRDPAPARCQAWASSSRACVRVVAVISAPPSMRASSSTRALRSSSAMRLTTPRSESSLLTRMLVRLRCHLRQVRDAQHLAVVAEPAHQRADASATAPPTPASASSKISVGTGFACAAITAIASPIRDSSPPDATRASGRGVAPACAATRNSTSSVPAAEGSAGSQTMLSRPPAIPSPAICCETPSARRFAALRRAADRDAAHSS